MIGIVDYGLGNIQAFANIYHKLNIDFRFVQTKDDLLTVDRVILPGVGAFDYAMNSLIKSGMRETLDHLVLEKKVPVLGICVGMQIMASASEEGTSQGLSWVDGVVEKIPLITEDFTLPHMGWNQVIAKKNNALLDGIENGSDFYFLHSFYFNCRNKEDVIAEVEYGSRFTSMIQKEHIFGIQCHPEKSHDVGIRTLENFARFAPC